MEHPTCVVEGCERRTRTVRLKFCQMHYRRVQRHGDPGGPEPLKVNRYVEDPCAVDGCERLAIARSYCLMHFKRIERTGDAGSVEPKAVTIRDRIDDQGYRRITVDGRKVKEHRYVMEQMIGRKLLPGENVHHLNGIRHDNRPENLELWAIAQTCGQRVTDQIAWAREILARYEPLELAGLI